MDMNMIKAYGQDEVDIKVKSRLELTRPVEHRQPSTIPVVSDSFKAA
jgi:hypothetical protein